MKLFVVFYSMYGHIYRMAEAVAEGAREVSGTQAELFRVPETIPESVLKQSGAWNAQQTFAHIPVIKPDQLAEADAIVFGSPTRFGGITGQMRNFLDQTGGLWAKNALVGKVGGVFTGSKTQHGGQEATILGLIPTLLHHGMIVVGLPYSFEGQSRMDEITGCSPYGASTIVGHPTLPSPTANELDGARFQGRHVAVIASKLFS